jgi:hypothetical protein
MAKQWEKIPNIRFRISVNFQLSKAFRHRSPRRRDFNEAEVKKGGIEME